MRLRKLTPQFVKYIPREVEAGVIYISMEFATANHRCCCGCGYLVVTPFSPTSWKLYFDGESISLRPSIGSWSFFCKSHYWITRNEVLWDRQFSDEEINAVRDFTSLERERYYSKESKLEREESESRTAAKLQEPTNLWQRLKRRFWG
jgi:hypothetical protein